MHTDLAPHLHTDECNILINALKQCHSDHPFLKFLGTCNSIETLMSRCLKKERLNRRFKNTEDAKIKRAAIKQRVLADHDDDDFQ